MRAIVLLRRLALAFLAASSLALAEEPSLDRVVRADAFVDQNAVKASAEGAESAYVRTSAAELFAQVDRTLADEATPLVLTREALHRSDALQVAQRPPNAVHDGETYAWFDGSVARVEVGDVQLVVPFESSRNASGASEVVATGREFALRRLARIVSTVGPPDLLVEQGRHPLYFVEYHGQRVFLDLIALEEPGDEGPIVADSEL